MNGLFLRALLAFLVLPGMVAFVVPAWLAAAAGRPTAPIGVLPFGLGVVGLLWCVRDFYVAGKGTLAPWSPPRELVIVGLYQYSRNPMYVSVLIILSGWALAFRSWTLLSYALLMLLLFHLRVVMFEEQWLAATFGDRWSRYKARVPRWIGAVRQSTVTGVSV